MLQHETEMHEWLRKNTEVAYIDFRLTLEKGATEGYPESPLYRDWIPKVFPQFVVGYYVPEPAVLTAVPEGTLRELLLESALAYAALRYAKCWEFGKHQLVFEVLLEAWNVLRSAEMVQLRAHVAAAGWHDEVYTYDLRHPHAEMLLSVYRQGQKAKREGRACGCDACLVEAAQRSLAEPLSVKKTGPSLFGDIDDEEIPF